MVVSRLEDGRVVKVVREGVFLLGADGTWRPLPKGLGITVGMVSDGKPVTEEEIAALTSAGTPSLPPFKREVPMKEDLKQESKKTTSTSTLSKGAQMLSWLEKGMISPNVPSPPPGWKPPEKKKKES